MPDLVLQRYDLVDLSGLLRLLQASHIPLATPLQPLS